MNNVLELKGNIYFRRHGRDTPYLFNASKTIDSIQGF